MEISACDLFPDWKRVYHSIHRKDGWNDAKETIDHDVLPYIGDLNGSRLCSRLLGAGHDVIRVDGLQTRSFQNADDLICG